MYYERYNLENIIKKIRITEAQPFEQFKKFSFGTCDTGYYSKSKIKEKIAKIKKMLKLITLKKKEYFSYEFKFVSALPIIVDTDVETMIIRGNIKNSKEGIKTHKVEVAMLLSDKEYMFLYDIDSVPYLINLLSNRI